MSGHVLSCPRAQTPSERARGITYPGRCTCGDPINDGRTRPLFEESEIMARKKKDETKSPAKAAVDKLAKAIADGEGSITLPEDDEPEPEERDGADEEGAPDSAPPSSKNGPAVKPVEAEAPALTRYLLHRFTESEINDLRVAREELDERIDAIGEKLEAAKTHAASLKKRHEGMIEESFDYARKIRIGEEMAEVECRVMEERGEDGLLYDVTYRCDTWTEIARVRVPQNRRQGDLFTATG